MKEKGPGRRHTGKQHCPAVRTAPGGSDDLPAPVLPADVIKLADGARTEIRTEPSFFYKITAGIGTENFRLTAQKALFILIVFRYFLIVLVSLFVAAA